jgi:hypothetical protein
MKLIFANIITLLFVTTVTTTNAWTQDQVVMLTSWADPNECTSDNFSNMVDNSNKQQGPYEPDVCDAGGTIPVSITLNNNGTECYVHPDNPSLVFWISPPPTRVDPSFKPSDDLSVTYLTNDFYLYNDEMNGTPIIPRSDCNEQGVCLCDAIDSIRDSMENDDSLQLGNLSGGILYRSTTPTIRPNSDPTCGISGMIKPNTTDDEALSNLGFCSPIQGTLELYSPMPISGGIISIQGLASAIIAGSITTMIIGSMI